MLRNPGLRKSVEQPVLDLNFAAAQIGSNGAPDSRIDFSRGTNAWFVDSDGLVKKSPHNLITQSEAINSSPWFVTSGITITANSITAPDGTLTADKLEKDASGFRAVISSFTGEGVSDYAVSFFVKEGTLDKATVLLTSDSATTLNARIAFDLTSETTTDYGSANLKSASITDVGDGWYRCTVEATFANQTSPRVYIYPGVHSESTAGFVYIWGVQVSQHTTLPVGNPYVKTEGSAVYAARLDHDPTWFMSAAQEQNLLQYSEMLDDSYWTKSAVSVTANAETDPLGGTTAEYVFATSPSGGFPYLQASFDTKKGAVHTVSFYAKAGEIDVVTVGIRTSSGGYVSDPFNDQALTSEWQRFSATFTANADAHIVRFFFGSGAKTWSGDQGFYIWGTQIEVGSTASTYHRTEGAPYYGEGATPKGLLIEEERTNLVTESEDFGTTWTMTGLTVDTDEVLAPDGTTSADFIEETTATSVHEIRMQFLVTEATSKHVLSCFVKAQDRTILRIAGSAFSAWATGGTWPNAFFDLSTETVTLSSGHSAGIEDYGNGWYRCHVVGTSGSSPTGAGISVSTIKSGTTTSYTGEAGKGLYVWGAQLEKGDFLTSYMQTTGTSLTRNADVAVMGPTTGGTELVTNGTFDTDASNWFFSNATLSSESGKLRVTSTGGSFAQANQLISTVVGRRYRLTADVDFGTSGSANVQVNAESDGGFTASESFTADGSASIDFTAQTTTPRVIVHIGASSSAGEYQEFDNVSVRELYPFEQYNPAEGTMYSESESTAEVLNSCVFVLTDRPTSGSATDRLEIRHYGSTANSSRMEVVDGAVPQASISPTQTSDFRRNALAYGTNSVNAAGDGVSGTEDTSVSVPSVDEVLIGSNTFNIDYTGYIKRLSYYPRRLSDEAIENLTSD